MWDAGMNKLVKDDIENTGNYILILISLRII